MNPQIRKGGFEKLGVPYVRTNFCAEQFDSASASS
jgi:hypothetical protein